MLMGQLACKFFTGYLQPPGKLVRASEGSRKHLGNLLQGISNPLTNSSEGIYKFFFTCQCVASALKSFAREY
jgi:hypothetical protein